MGVIQSPMLRKGRPGLSRRGETLEFTVTATADPGKVVIGVGKIRRSLMRRIVLAALVLLNARRSGPNFCSGQSDCESCPPHTAVREYSNHHMSDQL